MNVFTVRAYVTAIRLGSKYAYQTIPRILTIWLDLGEYTGKLPASRRVDTRKSDRTGPQKLGPADYFAQMNESIKQAIDHTPVYKVISQSVSGRMLLTDVYL